MLIWSVEKIEDRFFFNPSSYRYVASTYIRVGWLIPMYIQVPPDVSRGWAIRKKKHGHGIYSAYTSPTSSGSSASSSSSSCSSFACRAAKTDGSACSFLTFFALLFFWLVGLPWPLPFSFRQPNLNRCKRWWALRFKGNKENMRTWVPNVDHVLAQWLLPPWFSARSPGNKFATELDQELQLQLGAFRVSSEASTTAVRSARVFPSKIMSVSLGNSIRLNIFKEFEFERSWNLPAAHGTSWGLGIFDSCVTIWWRHLVVWNDVT